MAITIGLGCILAGYRPAGKGLVLGTLFSVLNFVLLGETLPVRINRTRKMTLLWSLGSIGCRYGLMAVPLLLALRLDQFSFLGVAAGLLMVQITIMGDHLRHVIFCRSEKLH